MIGKLRSLASGSHQRTVAWIVGIASAYDIGTLGSHLISRFGSPIVNTWVGEYSSSAAIALCIVALIFVRNVTQDRRTRLVALAIAGVFTVLALDDIFSIHERMNNDDYLAVFLWVVAGTVLLVLLRLERPDRTATVALCTGLLLHGLAALADGADGGIFTFSMITPIECAWTQEIFALAYLSLYIVGFSRMLARRGRIEPAIRLLNDDRSLVKPTRPLKTVGADRELLELEAWYWAWRSHVEVAETNEEGDWLIDEILSAVGKLTDRPVQSITGLAAKIRVLQDIMETVTPITRPEMEIEARLLAAVVRDANRLAETQHAGDLCPHSANSMLMSIP